MYNISEYDYPFEFSFDLLFLHSTGSLGEGDAKLITLSGWSNITGVRCGGRREVSVLGSEVSYEENIWIDGYMNA